jgi:hypothetical protein
MNEGWFRCELVATALRWPNRSADASPTRVILATGQPSTFSVNRRSTLALDTDQLPGGAGRGGILTPATGLGDTACRPAAPIWNDDRDRS